jgi:ubiquinone/menaquinone biosynthesis C-methylase UbiE
MGVDGIVGLSAAMTAASQTGLLVALIRRSASAEDYARELSLSARPVERVLDVLVAFGVAKREGVRFAPTAALTEYATMIPSGLESMLSLWSRTPEFLKTGEPVLRMDAEPAERQALYAKVVSSLGRFFAAAALEVASHIEMPPARVLDIGCGSGVWSLAIAGRFHRTRVTGLDLAEVLHAFEARAAEMGLADRIETLSGDVHTVPIPSRTFDLVLIANVLRIEEPAQAKHIIERAAEALKPNGLLVVIDAFGDGSPASEKALAIYALHLAMRTARGRVYSAREVQTWLSTVGLGATRDFTVPVELGPVGAIFARAG